MLLRVTHETRYDYAPAVQDGQHMLHLTPRADGGQDLLAHRLLIEPQPNQRSEAVDLYGNRRTFFAVQGLHTQLRVVADSVVRTASAPVPTGDQPWEQVREHFRYHARAQHDAANEFVFASPCVPRHEAFAAYARASFASGRGVLEAATLLMHQMHAELRYDAGSTVVNTPTLQALEQRRGVCQDFAHILVACLRAMGQAARYVSGYLLTEPAPGQPRLIGADASHAWASVYVPDVGWCDLDPTNDRVPDQAYVTLAIGRDFADVSPMRGVIHGSGNHHLAVAVTVAPLSEAQAQAAAAECCPSNNPETPS